MADNPQNEDPEVPASSPPELHTTEDNTPPDEYITNPNEEIPAMEVHKHPHHVTHKKKWGEYVLEFFMLFLAVFLGFVAENIREHNVEREREKEYVHSLVADLKSDQKALDNHIVHLQEGLRMADSMVTLLNDPSQLPGSTGQLYYFARIVPRLRPLEISSRTLDQLKNSGNFRLIKDLEASNKIINYYEKLILVHLLENINETEFSDYKKIAAKLFDPTVLLKMEDENGDIQRMAGNPPLRNYDAESLKELSVFSVYMHGTKKSIIKIDRDLQSEGAALIEYLRKEYHIE